MIDRREFLATTAGVAGAAGVSAAAAAAPAPQDRAGGSGRAGDQGGKPFALDYAPHFGQFKELAGSDDPVEQLRFMHAQGFRAVEDNGMTGRGAEEQGRIGAEIKRLGMRMGIFVVNPRTAFGRPTFAAGDKAMREEFLAEVRASVDVAKRCGAKWMTLVLGDLARGLEMDYQTANAVEQLRQASAILEPHGLVMVMEGLNPWRDHPGMFLTKAAQAYLICKAVASPSCKILFDLYHQQITEGNLIPNMDRCWDEVAYIQLGDTPGRCEPTTGEINYRNVFAHIKKRGYAGVLGMEHGKSRTGAAGERRVIEAYREVDPN